MSWSKMLNSTGLNAKALCFSKSSDGTEVYLLETVLPLLKLEIDSRGRGDDTPLWRFVMSTPERRHSTPVAKGIILRPWKNPDSPRWMGSEADAGLDQQCGTAKVKAEGAVPGIHGHFRVSTAGG